MQVFIEKLLPNSVSSVENLWWISKVSSRPSILASVDSVVMDDHGTWSTFFEYTNLNKRKFEHEYLNIAFPGRNKAANNENVVAWLTYHTFHTLWDWDCIKSESSLWSIIKNVPHSRKRQKFSREINQGQFRQCSLNPTSAKLKLVTFSKDNHWNNNHNEKNWIITSEGKRKMRLITQDRKRKLFLMVIG